MAPERSNAVPEPQSHRKMHLFLLVHAPIPIGAKQVIITVVLFCGACYTGNMDSRERIIAEYRSGLSVGQIVAKYNLSPGMVHRIRESLRKDGLLRNRGARARVVREGYRFCNTCQEMMPLTEQYFHKDKAKTQGYRYRCKDCCGTM